MTQLLVLLPNSLYHDGCFANFKGISASSIILADLLGNTCLLEQDQKVMVSDLWLVDFYPFFCFCVSRFVARDRLVSGNNRLVCFEDLSDLSYSCHLQE